MNMKATPIPLFATPASREALLDYVAKFSVEQEAAQLGFAHFNDENLNELVEPLKPAHRIVALTVAGMRWNLYCKELADELERNS